MGLKIGKAKKRVKLCNRKISFLVAKSADRGTKTVKHFARIIASLKLSTDLIKWELNLPQQIRTFDTLSPMHESFQIIH